MVESFKLLSNTRRKKEKNYFIIWFKLFSSFSLLFSRLVIRKLSHFFPSLCHHLYLWLNGLYGKLWWQIDVHLCGRQFFFLSHPSYFTISWILSLLRMEFIVFDFFSLLFSSIPFSFLLSSQVETNFIGFNLFFYCPWYLREKSHLILCSFCLDLLLPLNYTWGNDWLCWNSSFPFLFLIFFYHENIFLWRFFFLSFLFCFFSSFFCEWMKKKISK